MLAGRMRFRVGGRKVVAGPGQTVRVPPGTVHHFANAGPRPGPGRGADQARAEHAGSCWRRRRRWPRTSTRRAAGYPARWTWRCSCGTSSARCGRRTCRPRWSRAVIGPLAWLARRRGSDARYRRLRGSWPPTAAPARPVPADRPLAIEVAHLVKRYRGAGRNAVDDVSFDVPAGQLFCLLGPNGAGKTTTVSILTTTLAPTSGQVTIAGRDLARRAGRRPPGARRRLPAALARPQPDRRGEHPAARGALRAVPVAAAPTA